MVYQARVLIIYIGSGMVSIGGIRTFYRRHKIAATRAALAVVLRKHQGGREVHRSGGTYIITVPPCAGEAYDMVVKRGHRWEA